MRQVSGCSPFLLALLLLAGCGDRAAQYRAPPPSSVAGGIIVPRYAAMTLAGDTLRLEDFRGQVVLLNACATWCYPCVTELPVLQQLHERFGPQGLRVLGVSIDREEPKDIQRFLDTHGITYPNLKDRQWNLTQTFRWGVGIPKSLLIDREGRIALFWSGGVKPTSTEQVRFLTDTVAALVRRPSAPAVKVSRPRRRGPRDRGVSPGRRSPTAAAWCRSSNGRRSVKSSAAAAESSIGWNRVAFSSLRSATRAS